MWLWYCKLVITLCYQISTLYNALRWLKKKQLHVECFKVILKCFVFFSCDLNFEKHSSIGFMSGENGSRKWTSAPISVINDTTPGTRWTEQLSNITILLGFIPSIGMCWQQVPSQEIHRCWQYLWYTSLQTFHLHSWNWLLIFFLLILKTYRILMVSTSDCIHTFLLQSVPLSSIKTSKWRSYIDTSTANCSLSSLYSCLATISFFGEWSLHSVERSTVRKHWCLHQ